VHASVLTSTPAPTPTPVPTPEPTPEPEPEPEEVTEADIIGTWIGEFDEPNDMYQFLVDYYNSIGDFAEFLETIELGGVESVIYEFWGDT
jgi:hypothetical protein